MLSCQRPSGGEPEVYARDSAWYTIRTASLCKHSKNNSYSAVSYLIQAYTTGVGIMTLQGKLQHGTTVPYISFTIESHFHF